MHTFRPHLRYLGAAAVPALALLAVLLLTACGGGGRFRLDGTLDSRASQSLRASWVDADGSAVEIPVAARDGHFQLSGLPNPEGTVLTLATQEGTVLARLWMTPGVKGSVTLDRHRPEAFAVDGAGEVNDRWAAWIRANAGAIRAGDRRGLDLSVSRYVRAHRGDPLSALLVATAFDAGADPAEARRLLSLVDPEAVPAGVAAALQTLLGTGPGHRIGADLRYWLPGRDTLVTLAPPASGLLLVAVTDADGRRDSVRRALRGASSSLPEGFASLELVVAEDTVRWRAATRLDSAARGTQGWLPGGLGARGLDSIGVRGLPWFAVVDTAGAVTYSGPSLARALATRPRTGR